MSGTTTYSYDVAGNLMKSVDARQGLNPSTDGTTRTYDAANRMLNSAAVLTGQTTETTSWTYDDTVSTHYGKGRLASMADPSGSTTYAYDRRGLLKHEAKTIDFNTYTLAYGYDLNGNRSSITYPSGRIVNYTFDFADRPLTACSGGTGPTCTGGTSYASSAGYQPFGPESSLSYGNGTTRTMSYDQRYRPTELKLAGASTIYDSFYSEDAVGNILSICATSGTCSTSANPYNRVFTYDDLNRLTSANSGSSLWLTGGYAYDSMGNMTSATLGSTARAFTYLPNGASKNIPKLASTNESGIGMRNVTYDLSGNETMVGSGSFTYSPRNYLATGDGLSYEYDARGLRVATTRTGATLFPVSLTVEPQSVKGGGTATGTVTLNDTTGGTVTLSSSDASVTFPGGSTVTVPSLSASATFSIATTTPASDRKVVITATMGGTPNGVTVTAVLTVTVNPQLLLLSLSPRTVHGGNSTTGTIILNGPAPSGGTPVTLTSSSAIATFPGGPTVTVPFNSSSATFTVNTSAVGASTSVDIKASYSGVDRHAALVVVNYVVQRLAPSEPFLTGSGRPPLMANLSPASSGIFRSALQFSGLHLSPLTSGLNLELEQGAEGFWAATEDPTPKRMPIVLVASYPGPAKRNFIYSPEMNLLAESELARPREKTILYEYIWFNGHPVAQADGGAVTHWTFTDHLGTPLIQTTDSQAVWSHAEYEPYGRLFAYNPTGLPDQHQPLRLPGQEAEQLNLGQNGATERSYNIFRWYRPSWGRYTQPDPAGTPTFQEPDPYVYVQANPIRVIDPVGLFAVDSSCDCNPNYPDVTKGIAKACSYLKKPACADILKQFSFKSGPLLPCMQERCSGKMPVRCVQRSYCGEYVPPLIGGGAILIGQQTCPGGRAGTVFHEALHSCGLEQEPYKNDPYSSVFRKIMLVCTGNEF